MRGFIYKRVHHRRDGKDSILYYAVIETTRPGTTKRTKDWGPSFRTRKAAEAALAERMGTRQAGAFVATNRLTLGEFLRDQWLSMLRDRNKATTRNSYERTVNTYIVPRIGGMRLQDITAAHLTALYAELRVSGGTQQSPKRRGEPKALAPKTVRNVHAVISKAFNDAIDFGLLQVNPAARAKPPRQRISSQKVDAWTADELRAFLDFAQDDRLYACWHLAAYTGMRRGELLGLRWEDLDLDRARLAVRQTIVLEYTTPIIETPKSHEARVINLDEDTVGVLIKHQEDQEGEGEAWGLGYAESGLVFTRENGDLINPDRLSQMFDRLVRLSGIRRIKFHGLRHTHATLMLKAGVPVKVVSERLGHADPAFTMRVYQHVTSGMQVEAARQFAASVRTAIR
jgi:integrase